MIIRTIRPGYANYNANHESLSLEIEMAKRTMILSSYMAMGKRSQASLNHVGEFHLNPSGTPDLQTVAGFSKVQVSYIYSSYGFPWIILGSFANTSDFLQELADDEDLSSLRPEGTPSRVDAIVLAEEDFDLSEVQYHDIRDLRNL